MTSSDLFLAFSGYFGLFLAHSGYFWLFLALSGHFWPFLAISSYFWPFLDKAPRLSISIVIWILSSDTETSAATPLGGGARKVLAK
mgnify:CR=1 FL=1